MFVPVHKLLLDYARTLGFGPILLRWRPNMRDFPATFAFCVNRTDLPLFLLYLRTAFFEAHLLSPEKKWQVCSLKSYKVLMETPYTIITQGPFCQFGLLLKNWYLNGGQNWPFSGGLRNFVIKRHLFYTFMPQGRQKTSFLHLCAPNTLFGISSYPSD